jgi:hypothetical protein
MSYSIWVTIFTIAGSLFIFYSWVVENYLAKKSDNKISEQTYHRDYLTNLQNAFPGVFLQARLFDTLDIEKNTDRSRKDYTVALNQCLQLSIDLVDGIADILSLDVKLNGAEIIRLRKITSIMKEKNHSESLDTAEMRKDLVILTVEINKGSTITTNINDFLGKMTDRSNFYNTAFLVCYIMGSLFLGVAYFIFQVNQP